MLISGLVLTSVLVTVLFYSSGLSDCFALFKSSVARMTENPVLRAELGEPVERGWFYNFKIGGSGLTGHARFTTSFVGPKGKVEANILLDKRGGIWEHASSELWREGQREPLLTFHGREVKASR
ncbi:hypothetical protein [Archangium lipolyticum]|uniref:hypothetical protein n=1 Tax=Archangium lipolyticum TaxID=2970465 RepID=UPI00214A0C65|nr:hypothetical protein [Archangium lipolyticum]